MSVTSCINILIRNKVSLPKSIIDGSIFGLGLICLVGREFMCDCSVFLSGANVVYVIERMQKTFICNYLPLKLNFLARRLWKLVLCFMLFSDYYFQSLIPAHASLCRLQPSYFHGLDDTRAYSSKRGTFVNNRPVTSAIKQKEILIIID